MKRILLGVAAALLLSLAALGYFLLRPLSPAPVPAEFQCYDLGQGAYVPLDAPSQAFGIGLSYAGHIEETASSFDPDAAPPVFVKSRTSLVRSGDKVPFPTPQVLIEGADSLEIGLGKTLRGDFPDLAPLLDYEVEMGLVLLEDIDPSRLDDPSFAPRLGFFIANDLSARSLGILGEGRANRHAYWGLSKSFPGFMPVGDKAWVPENPTPNGIPCVEIESLVNGEVRQHQSTADLIYTPAQMLRFIHGKFPEAPLLKGTIVLTGTPGGVAMRTPRWLVRASNLVGLSRFRKLATKLDGDTSRFLQVGDEVTVRGQGLGKVSVTIAANDAGQP
jgi:2-keto-4-pentenoate hydratase/2-oxohepta-3-ene-1,7-dioic acid hydratase in catechol pathway